MGRGGDTAKNEHNPVKSTLLDLREMGHAINRYSPSYEDECGGNRKIWW
jgi:hypothetical protein